MQFHRLGKHASNTEPRQCCAFPGLPLRIRFAPRHGGHAILANVTAAEASGGAGRPAYIDFVSSRAKNKPKSASAVHIAPRGKNRTTKKQNNKNLGEMHG